MKNFILKIGIDDKNNTFKINENISELDASQLMGTIGLLTTVIHKYEHILAERYTKKMEKN